MSMLSWGKHPDRFIQCIFTIFYTIWAWDKNMHHYNRHDRGVQYKTFNFIELILHWFLFHKKKSLCPKIITSDFTTSGFNCIIFYFQNLPEDDHMCGGEEKARTCRKMRYRDISLLSQIFHQILNLGFLL